MELIFEFEVIEELIFLCLVECLVEFVWEMVVFEDVRSRLVIFHSQIQVLNLCLN